MLCHAFESQRGLKVTITTPSYKDLYDGVHPSDQLSEKWFSFLCRSIESELKECPEEPLSSSSSSESSAEDSDCDTQPDTWDYKRSRATIREQ